MTTETAVQTTDQANAALIERVVMQGDLSQLDPEQRMDYYRLVCESIGLNPLTQPFDYIVLNGKLRLYAKKDATDQIRAIRGISVTSIEREMVDDVYTVTAYGRDASGRTDAAIGAVPIGPAVRGEARANAMMKAETKAKRRMTLSLSGLGILDELEVGASVPSVNVDRSTGEIIGQTEVKTLRERAEEAAAAAEGPQEAPQEADVVEVDADTIPLFDEAPVASEGPEDLTDEELRKMCRHALIPMGTVATTAKRLFPDAKRTDELTDAQRGALWIVLMTEKDQ